MIEVSSEWNGRDVKIKGKRMTEGSAFEIGLVVQDQAKHLAPKDTGRLRGSITVQTAAGGQRTEPVAPAGSGDVIAPPADPNEVLVGTAVHYGPYMEFGTIKTDAQPFLRPALDLAQGRTLTIVQRNARWHLAEYLRE